METSETKSELQKLKDSCKEKYKYWEGMVRDLWKNYSINDDLAEYEGARRLLVAYAVSELGYQELIAKDEIRRINHVIRLEREAGSLEDRERLEAEFESARQDLSLIHI